jgi:hypothetical protein
MGVTDSIISYLSVSGVDLTSLLVALGYGKLICSRAPGQAYISRDTALSVLHGLVIFPLVLLVVGAVFPPALSAILQSNKVILAGASLVALFSMFEHPGMSD